MENQTIAEFIKANPDLNILKEKGQGIQKDKQPTQQEIQNARMLLKMNREGMRDRTRHFVESKTTNPFAGKPLNKLIKTFQNKSDTDHDKLMETIDKLEDFMKPKNVSAGDAGTTYPEMVKLKKDANAALDDYIFEKAGFVPNGPSLNALSIKYGIEPGSIRHKKLKDLIALDDWTDVAKFALPYIEQYGPRAVEYLWGKLVNKMKQFSGHDSGLDYRDYNNNNVQMPSKQSIISGANLENAGTMSKASLANYARNGVSQQSVATVVCPERFQFRRQRPYSQKTAVLAGSTQLLLTSDASGISAAYINPDAIITGVSTSTTAFFAQINPVGLVPSTGTASSWTAVAGPQFINAGQFFDFIVTSFSIIVTPVTSANNSSGTVEIGYFQGIETSSQPITPIQGLTTNPYYQTGNMLTSYRALHVPDAIDLFTSTALSPNATELFYVLATGLPPTTTALKIDCYYTYEVHPVPSVQAVAISDYPQAGPSTQDFITIMFQMFPGVQMQTFDDAFVLAQKIMQSKPDWDCMLSTILEHASGYKPKLYKSIMSGPKQDISDMSFEQILSQ